MGKKKMPKKTKELSVAIAESSSMVEETQQQQQQIITPRKRGRPRKIVEKTEGEEIKEAEEIKVEEEAETESKKAKTIGEEEKEQHVEEAAGATSAVVKELQPQRRSSRARRKSKPRKSS
ncbi:hypothetical protein RHSIM_Rhsim06G0033800 [Rhododendron simsii]|uniref:Uncharacterized protein n=1 Tax=Rhododendron simsii TaxID=118357 RepID=A0A834H1F3_RHOSS|nr:hypothetical protein RHSIM_Rhsim06G0033800 [Rhododendron simsii]